MPAAPPADPNVLLPAHLDRLFAVLYRRVRHYQNAEDLTNDTVTLVLAKWHRYDPARPFWPWLVSVALRVLASAGRSGKLSLPADLAGGASHSGPAADEPPPLDFLVTAEDRRRLRDAVDALPEDEREAVLLFYFDDAPARDVADAIGLPTGTVYRLLHQARRRCAAALADRPGGD